MFPIIPVMDEATLAAVLSNSSAYNDYPLDIPYEGEAFSFCQDLEANNLTVELDTSTNTGFHIDNALWLAFLSGNEYAHYAHLAPVLEELGFGNPGDGEQWRQRAGLIQDLVELEATNQSFIGAPECVKTDFLRAAYAGEKMQFFSMGSTQVLWAEHAEENMAVLVFRGTDPTRIEDLITDARFLQEPLAGWGNVHIGFNRGWLKVKELVMANLKSVENRPDVAGKPFRVWVTGHSLGAALATISTTAIIDSIEHGDACYQLGGLYTYGQPRTGDAEFRTALHAVASGYLAGEDGDYGTSDDIPLASGFPLVRFRHGNDPVAQLPSRLMYPHVGQSFHLAAGAIENLGLENLGRTESEVSGLFEDHDMGNGYMPALRRLNRSELGTLSDRLRSSSTTLLSFPRMRHSLELLAVLGVFMFANVAQGIVAKPMPNKRVARALLDAAGIQSYTYDLDQCLRQAPSFPTVQVVGSYSDLTNTCGLVATIVSGKVGRGSELTTLALQARNWAELTSEDRIDVARSWVHEVLLLDRKSLHATNAHFALAFTPVFSPPASSANKDGSISLEMWVQSSGSPSRYQREHFEFSDDGELTRQTLSWFQISEGS